MKGTKQKAYQWGALDCAPMSKLAKESARAVRLSLDDYRAAKALIERAPWHIMTSWEREELTTPEAYAALMKWEGTP